MNQLFILVVVLANVCLMINAAEICPEDEVYSDYIQNAGIKNCTRLDAEICPEDEEYSPCKQNAGIQNCTQLNDDGDSDCDTDESACTGGCICKAGYLRDSNGKCIPKDQCCIQDTIFCQANEDLRCVKPCPPETTCRTRGILYNCIEDPKPCELKCVCKNKYFRNAIGECITGAECDKCNGPHEFFSCGSACDNVCENLDSQNRTNCPIVNIKCNPMCYCEDGYARDHYGNCIPVDKCPIICPVNEKYIHCKQNAGIQNCTQLDHDGNSDCDTDESGCTGGCICKAGYLRDSNGKCIPKDQCCNQDTLSCPPNEEARCVKQCPPETTCSTRGRVYRCKDDPKPCENKCVCKKGYYRSPIGECITGAECDKCNGSHEFFSCGQACDNVCKDLATQNRTNCPIINKTCNRMCYCEDGYARDRRGNCIPVDECSKALKCGSNEEYTCKTPCPPEICQSILAFYKCAVVPCEMGCHCKSGFLRKKLGSPCIPTCQCEEMKNDPECQKKDDDECDLDD